MGESSLVQALLAITPEPTKLPKGKARRLFEADVQRDCATVTAPIDLGQGDDSVSEVLIEAGLNPAEWECSSWRKSKWDSPKGEPLEAMRWSFRRVTPRGADSDEESFRNLIESLADDIAAAPPLVTHACKTPRAMVIGLADMQFAKIDGGLEKAIATAFALADRATEFTAGYLLDEIVITLAGDHVEGFASQSGKNAWRTQLTLTQQIALFRRLVLRVIVRLRQLHTTVPIKIVAVPGNHGRVEAGAGVATTHDDSHDTASIMAIKDVLDSMGVEANLEFIVPQPDEIIASTRVADLNIAVAHGDRCKPDKALDWWSGQAFGNPSLADVDLLITGHYHSFKVATHGERMWVQLPAMELESTYYRHLKGTPGNPGALVVQIVGDQVVSLHPIGL